MNKKKIITVACKCGYKFDIPTYNTSKTILTDTFCSSKCLIDKIHSYEPKRLPFKTSLLEEKYQQKISANIRAHSDMYNITSLSGFDMVFPLRSSPEKRLAIILNKHKIQWLYEAYYFEISKGLFYNPDFYIPSNGVYIEVKGLWENDDWRKVSLFKESCHPYLIIEAPIIARIFKDDRRNNKHR